MTLSFCLLAVKQFCKVTATADHLRPFAALLVQVLVGSPPSPQATISVASLPPPLSHTAAAAAALQQAKVVPEPCVLLASRAQEAAADIMLQLEYKAGGRQHCCLRVLQC